MEQIIEIKVDPPKGYAAVDFRRARPSEPFMYQGRVVHQDEGTNFEVLILEKEYRAPKWLKPGLWYAEDAEGTQFVYTKRPTLGESVFHPVQDSCAYQVESLRALVFFTPPPKSIDWRKSLRRLS